MSDEPRNVFDDSSAIARPLPEGKAPPHHKYPVVNSKKEALNATAQHMIAKRELAEVRESLEAHVAAAHLLTERVEAQAQTIKTLLEELKEVRSYRVNFEHATKLEREDARNELDTVQQTIKTLLIALRNAANQLAWCGHDTAAATAHQIADTARAYESTQPAYPFGPPMETVDRWGLLPSTLEPSYMTGARPEGTEVFIRSTGETVRRVGQEWRVVKRNGVLVR